MLGQHQHQQHQLVEQAAASISVGLLALTVILSSIVVCTIVGNLFVILAILVDKNLQTAANQLVLSLAVADLMVACLVMPLGAYNDLQQGWYLSRVICEFWTSADVLCCTASILNLLAIAIDRYWAVTNVDYIYKRTRQRVGLMILCAWTVAAVVSLAPIFGWKDPDFADRVLIEHKCLVSQDVSYQVFATISTFYAPLVLLLALYWRIFQVARKRIRRKPGRDQPGVCPAKQVAIGGGGGGGGDSMLAAAPAASSKLCETKQSAANCEAGGKTVAAFPVGQTKASSSDVSGGGEAERDWSLACEPVRDSPRCVAQLTELQLKVNLQATPGLKLACTTRRGSKTHLAASLRDGGGGTSPVLALTGAQDEPKGATSGAETCQRETRLHNAHRWPSDVSGVKSRVCDASEPGGHFLAACLESKTSGNSGGGGDDDDDDDDQDDKLASRLRQDGRSRRRLAPTVCHDDDDQGDSQTATCKQANGFATDNQTHLAPSGGGGIQTGPASGRVGSLSKANLANCPRLDRLAAVGACKLQASASRPAGASSSGNAAWPKKLGQQQIKGSSSSNNNNINIINTANGCATSDADCIQAMPLSASCKPALDNEAKLGTARHRRLPADRKGCRNCWTHDEDDYYCTCTCSCCCCCCWNSSDRATANGRTIAPAKQHNLCLARHKSELDDDEDDDDHSDVSQSTASGSSGTPSVASSSPEASLSTSFPPQTGSNNHDGEVCKDQQELHIAIHDAVSPVAKTVGQHEPASKLIHVGSTTKVALELRRKFRVLGQLVSFVQTSRQFHSSSSEVANSEPEESSGTGDVTRNSRSRAQQDLQFDNRQASQILPANQVSTIESLMSDLGSSIDTTGKSCGRVVEHQVSASITDPATAKQTESNLMASVRRNQQVQKGQQQHRQHQQQHQQKHQQTVGLEASKILRQQASRSNADIKREKKAAKTLAIITGVFVCCWLPFFVNALLMPICGSACTPSDLILSVLLWLGYLNSLLNPIIYTIFSPDFRRAFSRLLCSSVMPFGLKCLT